MDWEMPEGVTRLFLVRHGETEATARGLIAGRLDVALSRRGLEQVRSAALWLSRASLAAVYASTSRRALESARVIAEPRGLTPVRDPDLREIDFGVLEGLTFDEAVQRYPETATAWLAHPHAVEFPGGERPEDLGNRVVRAAARISARHPSTAIALVCHAGPIRALVCDALGFEPARALPFACSHGSVTVLDLSDGPPLIRALNVTW